MHGVEPDAGSLVSGEGVRLALSGAGVGSRTVAAAVDAAIQFAALIVLVLLDRLIGTSDVAALAAILVTEAVLVLAGYPIVMEWLTRGRTVGKLVFGLRVVRDDGGPIGFRQALVRGLAGLVLEKPGLLAPLSTALGVLTISLSAREKRIGDMLAGTIVLDERSVPAPVPAPAWVPPPLQQWVLSLDLSGLDDQLALRLRQFVGRAYGMTPAAQHALGDELRRRLLAVVSPPPAAVRPDPRRPDERAGRAAPPGGGGRGRAVAPARADREGGRRDGGCVPGRAAAGRTAVRRPVLSAAAHSSSVPATPARITCPVQRPPSQ